MNIAEYYLRLAGCAFEILIGWGLICPTAYYTQHYGWFIIFLIVTPVIAYNIILPVLKFFK